VGTCAAEKAAFSRSATNSAGIVVLYRIFIVDFLLLFCASRLFLGRRSLGEVGWPFAGVLREMRLAVTQKVGFAAFRRYRVETLNR
jgi:hypothetical protein